MEKEITILGSTGSIGTQALDVCRNLGLSVKTLTAGRNVGLLEKQAREFLPKSVVIADAECYSALKTALADTNIAVKAGADAISDAAAEKCDTVLSALIGIAGLRPTLAALDAGNPVALANKEALVVGGSLVTAAAQKSRTPIIPVDSEHSAIFQCLAAGRRNDLKKILLTASGGPFWRKNTSELEAVTPEDALRHPNWKMGAKITIDSASLMNKGLEFIEAMWLFTLSPDQIEIIIHRQSILHSAVEFADGAVIAQLGTTDMHGAIQYALSYPSRMPTAQSPLSLTEIGMLTFDKPDYDSFPCLNICIDAARKGGLAPCVASSADEAAVELFLQGKIKFTDIPILIAGAVEKLASKQSVTLQTISEADNLARNYVKSSIS